MAVGFNIAATTLTTTFADDKVCKKNDDNNCNETKKIQKSSPKAECEVDTEIKDHNKNSIVGPIDLQCNSNSQSLIDSNIGSRTGDGIGGGDGGGNANIELSPTSGPIGTSAHITGTGFDQFSDVLITFDSSNVVLTKTNLTGGFSAIFTVPTSTTGQHTVAASDGINSDSTIFEVTSGAASTANQQQSAAMQGLLPF
jgi:hypothetical protein